MFSTLVSCLSSIVSRADSIRCRAISASKKAFDGAVLTVVAALKSRKGPVSLPPPPTKTLPLSIDPSRTFLIQTDPSLWAIIGLLCLLVLIVFAVPSLPGPSCIDHPEMPWYNIRRMLQSALPGPNALIDAPLRRRHRCPEFWGSRSWKAVTRLSVTNAVHPAQLFQLKTLGSGAFAGVIQVWSVERGKTLAVKRIGKVLSSTGGLLHRVNVWSSVSWEMITHRMMEGHPAFPVLHGAFHDAEYYYLVIDCGDSCLLDITIQSRRMALSYGLQLAHALKDLHERGIMHSDLKEDNLLLGSDQRLMLIDFGLAHIFDMDSPQAEHYPRWTALRQKACPGDGRFPLLWPGTDNPHSSQVHGGTPGYMSPPAERRELCSYGSDLFAFGTLLQEWMLDITVQDEDPVVAEIDRLFFERMMRTYTGVILIPYTPSVFLVHRPGGRRCRAMVSSDGCGLALMCRWESVVLPHPPPIPHRPGILIAHYPRLSPPRHSGFTVDYTPLVLALSDCRFSSYRDTHPYTSLLFLFLSLHPWRGFTAILVRISRNEHQGGYNQTRSILAVTNEGRARWGSRAG
ncbi:kinase-like domain-containing protein [Mycena albidolilacea]|uniref:non-specific serine/threonine protein kinase n=1 Tax=Mycena albidolilacea TaxID=1033008 RepID=A0AAD7ACA9_9AGAR|nr:kinase-like domain-containing protein [Mycena albidolilacea]